MPRSRKTFSSRKNSSFVESSPGTSSTRGGRSPSAAGLRRLPTTRPPSSGTSTRSASGSRYSWVIAIAATARSAAARLRSGSTTQTNFAKW